MSSFIKGHAQSIVMQIKIIHNNKNLDELERNVNDFCEGKIIVDTFYYLKEFIALIEWEDGAE